MRPSLACAALLLACAPTWRRRGSAYRLVSPGFIRDAGLLADSGAPPPPGLGTSTPAAVAAAVARAIERNKVELAVAPLRQRMLAHIGLGQSQHRRRGDERRAPARRRRRASLPVRRTRGRPRLWKDSHEQRFFGARSTLEVSGRNYEIHRLDALQERFDVARLPYSLKVLLENVLRLEDGRLRSPPPTSRRSRAGTPRPSPSVEIPFQPARVLMQDFTGVPAVVDLAAMRDAMAEIGGDPEKINPLVDVDLVIDHSVQVDAFGNERRLRGQRRARVRAQPRALLVPASGGSRRSTTSAWCRRRPASATRSTSSTSPRSSTAARRTARCGLSRHPGRHRLAHDDGQRARRAGLGRGRDRGRGGDARAADLDAAAAGGRLQARRRAARGRRPPPTWCSP